MSLIEYIKGRRHGKEAHRIERESMQDPFLSDAIDGFDSAGGDHMERIENMRRQLLHRTNQNKRWLTYAGIAASIIVIVSIGGYFVFNNKQDEYIAKGVYSLEKDAADMEILPESVTSEDAAVDAGVRDERARQGVTQESRAVNEMPKTSDISAEAKKDVVIAENIVVADNTIAKSSDEPSGAEADVAKQDDLLAKVEETEEGGAAAQEQLKKPVSSGTGLAQTATGQEKKKPTRLETPEPKTGWRAYRKYLVDSLRRPSSGDCAKSKGTVEVTFHIDKDGKPYDFVIGKSLCPDADAEAIRLVKEGGLWTCESYMRMTVSVKF